MPRQLACSLPPSLIAGLLLLAPNANAQQHAEVKFDFSIANIMRGPELYGREPANVRWTLDGKWIYFTWLEPGTDWRVPARAFRVRAEAGAKPEHVPPGDTATFMESGRLSPDGHWRLYDAGGTLTIVNVASGATRVVTQTLEAKTNAIWSADSRQLFYTSADNEYAISLDSSYTRQLTDIRVSADATLATGSPAAGARGGAGGGAGRGGGRGGAVGGGRGGGGGARGATGTDSSGAALDQRAALARQQTQLFQVLRDRAFEDSVARADGGGRSGAGAAGGRAGGAGGRGGRGGGGGADAAPGAAVQPIRPLTLMDGERITNLVMSPSGRAILISTNTPSGRSTTSTIVPSWVTATGYVEEINGRSKVGDVAQGTGRLLYMSLPSGDVHALSLTGATPTLASTAVLGWNDAGTAALVTASSNDFKNRWTYTVSADSGRLSLIEALHDSAWIGGPCNRCAGWIDNGRRVYWVSEADGYAHLYSSTADGTDKKQLTRGKWEVDAVQLSLDKQSFYLTTSEQSAFEQHFYRMPIGGGAREKITDKVGGHTVTMSPDQTMLADVYSYANCPPELYVMANKVGAPWSQLTLSPSKEWLSFNWLAPEIVMIPASDGIMVPAHIFRPKDMKATPNNAAVIFVHGAGYLHNVMNYWPSSYPREYMFNQYLASKGYVVIDIDYRGSAGYGRDWRTAIYRWMGGRDLQDQVDGVKYLQKNYGIDPSRVGIYGGSYGGFMTLMALFTQPQWFGAGAALRSVTDWAHYNHGYTAPILNLPEDDTLAYRRSSPIFFADGLKAPLIMFHGMVDTNVEFEDIVRLTQRLIELGKKNWELAPYPVEDHSFVRPDSWTDEYTRIFDLFESTIRRGSKKLPTPGARE